MSAATMPPRPSTSGVKLERIGTAPGPRPTTSAGSVMSGSSMGSSASGEAMSQEIERIQIQTGVFQRKTQFTKKEIKDLESEIALVRKDIRRYRQNMGGVQALANNDKFVAHEIAVMEGRLLKAKVTYMNCMEHNRELRVAVDDVRRERIIQQDVSRRLKEDIFALVKDSDQVEVDIRAKERQHEKVQQDVAAFKEWAKRTLEAHEAKYHEVGELRISELCQWVCSRI